MLKMIQGRMASARFLQLRLDLPVGEGRPADERIAGYHPDSAAALM